MNTSRKIRCAIYCRKSCAEGLDQAFNSLHAQREACRAYIESQRHEGWIALDDRYDDRASRAAPWIARRCSVSSGIFNPAESTRSFPTRSIGFHALCWISAN